MFSIWCIVTLAGGAHPHLLHACKCCHDHTGNVHLHIEVCIRWYIDSPMRVVHLAVYCNFGSHIVGAMSGIGGKGGSFKDVVGGYFKKMFHVLAGMVEPVPDDSIY